MKCFNKSLFKFLIIALLAVGASYSALAQSPAPTPSCPTIRASSPDSVTVGQPLTYTVNVNGGDPNVTPTYNWTISSGTISAGQGTSSITVNTAGLGDTAITATVDVGGYSRECSTSNSSTSVVMKAAAEEGRKFDEYGKLKSKDEQARLDSFVIELQNDPTTQGYLISYGGRKSKAGDAQKSAATAKNYLVKKRKLATSRLVTVDGGYKEEQMTELWIVPSGANPPMVSPTVDPSEVQSPKKKPAPKKKTTNKKA